MSDASVRHCIWRVCSWEERITHMMEAATFLKGAGWPGWPETYSHSFPIS